MKRFFAIALIAIAMIASTPALAAPKECTSSQTAAINSQTSTVASYERTVTNDTKKNLNATVSLQRAQAFATRLQSQMMATQRKIATALAGVVKNSVSNPSIARGYQSTADMENFNLRQLEGSYKLAERSVSTANRVANSTATALKISLANLAFQQNKLKTLMSKCTR